jgi:hypothetical protein
VGCQSTGARRTLGRGGLVVAVLVLALAASRAPAQDHDGATARDAAPQLAPDAREAVTPPDLPAIGKWMIARDGSVAHWLGALYDGKRLREPINIVIVDRQAKSAGEARQRLLAAVAAAGYPIRFGHSTGYRALIGGLPYRQLPSGYDDAFSDGIFELTNNHGRLFGPSVFQDAYVAIGAFSREEMRPFRWPEHGYASFNRARDDFAQSLDRRTPFRRVGPVDLSNAIADDPDVTTGDHDGRAVLLIAR